MRFAVVVIALAAACTKPVPQPPDCESYVSCYFDNGGYQRLADTINKAADDGLPADPELACYQGFAGASARDDLDKIIDPMLRAYQEGGTCWAGGYASVADTEGLEQKYADACEAHCRLELAAECKRGAANKAACPDDEAAAAFCTVADNAALIETASCPGGEGEGE